MGVIEAGIFSTIDPARLKAVQTILPLDGQPLIAHNGELERSYGGVALFAIGLLGRARFAPVQKLADKIRDRHRPMRAYDFFQKAAQNNQVDRVVVDRIFATDGRLNIDSLIEGSELAEAQDPYQMTAADLQQFLLNRIGGFYELTNPSLNSSSEFGFNSHNLQHVVDVSNRTISILEQIGADEGTKKRALIAGILHDMGNVFSRKQHELISLRLSELLFPELQTDQKQWDIVTKGIVYHNESSLCGYFDSCIPPAKLPSERIAALQQLPQEVLALIVADKTDWGRHRATQKRVGHSALGENRSGLVDWHLLVDEAVSGSDLNLGMETGVQKNTPRLEIVFKPRLSKEEERQHKQFTPDGKKTVFFPAFIHHLHREYGIPHSSVWQSYFWQTHLDRNMLMAEAVFALLPEADRLIIQIRDDDGGPAEQNALMVHPIVRSEIDQFPIPIKRKYFPKEKR